MQGTNSKQADILFKGVVEYYANISGTTITAKQVSDRDKILSKAGIVCPDSMDSKVLKYQNDFLDASHKNQPDVQKTIVESVIALIVV